VSLNKPLNKYNQCESVENGHLWLHLLIQMKEDSWGRGTTVEINFV